MPLSTAGLRAVLAQETGEAFLILLTISHPDLSVPVRLVYNETNIVSRGETFFRAAFQIILPDDSEDVPTTTIRVDNVAAVDPNDGQEKRVSDYVRLLQSPPTVTLEIVLGSSPDVLEGGPYDMVLQRADYDALEVTGELGFDDMLNEPYPGDSFTPSLYPGLF